MKQQLISFLGELWISDVERIEESNVTNNPAVVIYPTRGYFCQGLLKILIKFADNNGYRFYISSFDDDVRMRIFENV